MHGNGYLNIAVVRIGRVEANRGVVLRHVHVCSELQSFLASFSLSLSLFSSEGDKSRRRLEPRDSCTKKQSLIAGCDAHHKLYWWYFPRPHINKRS
jgi:hypothetical protein